MAFCDHLKFSLQLLPFNIQVAKHYTSSRETAIENCLRLSSFTVLVISQNAIQSNGSMAPFKRHGQFRSPSLTKSVQVVPNDHDVLLLPSTTDPAAARAPPVVACAVALRVRRLLQMWKLCLRLLAVLAVCLSTATQAQSDLFLLSPKRSGAPQPVARYCGEKLSNALKLVCRGNYNTMFKKASQDVSDSESEDNYWSGQSADEAAEAAAAALPPYPILARPSAGGLLTGAVFRRRTRGVFDECCRKSCSISELQTYCGRR